MDLDVIRMEVFKQTGLNIEKSDPFYAALVMLSTVAADINRRNDTALENIMTTARQLMANNDDRYREHSKLLKDTVQEIRSVVSQVTGMQDGIERAAANRVQVILYGEGGPVDQLKDLMKQQHEALGWLNRATDFYTESILPAFWPMFIASLLCSLSVGLLVKYL